MAEAEPKEEPESPTEPEEAEPETLDDDQLEALTTAVQAALHRTEAAKELPPVVAPEVPRPEKKLAPEPPSYPPPPHVLKNMEGYEKRKLYRLAPPGAYKSRRHFELVVFGAKRPRGGNKD